MYTTTIVIDEDFINFICGLVEEPIPENLAVCEVKEGDPIFEVKSKNGDVLFSVKEPAVPTDLNHLVSEEVGNIGIGVTAPEPFWQLRLEVPGFNKDNLVVTVEGSNLYIRGKNNYDDFSADYTIPDDAFIDSIKAQCVDGTLVITCEKASSYKAEVEITD
jgi:hypothetical protein